MFNLKFKSWIAVIIAGLLFLVGCGQTGPLYLPAESNTATNQPAGHTK